MLVITSLYYFCVVLSDVCCVLIDSLILLVDDLIVAVDLCALAVAWLVIGFGGICCYVCGGRLSCVFM